MAKLIVLGSSNAIPTQGHENTHFVFRIPGRIILVDCGPNPIVRLEQVSIDPCQVTDIFLTHFHPDHTASLPLFLMDLWLMKRKQSLTIYGLDYTIDRVEAMMDLYGWREWSGLFEIKLVRIPSAKKIIALEDDSLRVSASPVKHFIPNICLRFDLKQEKKSFAYSSDTEPCQAVVEISRDVDILIHECANTPGHSSAAQAGEIAQKAGARSLYLIHYPGNISNGEDMLVKASQTYPGPVKLALDFMEIALEADL